MSFKGFRAPVVVVLGTSQPFNALLRKTCAHPTPGEKKTMGRALWEVVHKGVTLKRPGC